MRKKLLAFYLLVSIASVSLWPISSMVLTSRLNVAATAAVPAPQPGQSKVVLKNLGMICPFCKAAITAKLKQTPGVIAYDVDLKTDSATVLYDPAKVDIERLKRTIAEAGFQVRDVEEVGQ